MTHAVLPRSMVFAMEALDPLPELARQAEAAGFSRVFTTEYLHRDSVARALAIALGTTRIGVGTGIAYAFTRAPLAMAALSADVQRLSQNRFALGISSGTRGVRRWYDAEFDPPGPRIVEYADKVRAAWARNPDLLQAPPIYGAALNPVMGRLVRRSCDGVLLHPLALARTHLTTRLLPALEHREDSRRSDFDVIAWCVTSIADEPGAAVERARRQLAFYFSTPSYRTVAEGTEWADVPRAVREAFDASDRKASWSELAQLVPEDLVDELALAGTPSEVRARLALLEPELVSLGVTELVFQTVGADLSEQEIVANCQLIASELGPNVPAALVPGRGAGGHD
jgi:alkanesulfonate monooxygenase SsuD/methylene tetrahydromethanopterin reductase-like flavin-dependent oxidoreductase (luciferase family)